MSSHRRRRVGGVAAGDLFFEQAPQHLGEVVNELVDGDYLSKHRVGRHNFYEVHPSAPLRHPLHRDHAVGSSWSYYWEKVAAGSAGEPLRR